MKLSGNGKKFIKSHEGFKNTYYDLKDGGLTVGFGNYMTYATARSKGIKIGDKITDAQADTMFNTSAAGFVAGVNAQIKQYNHKVNQNQFDALVSYAYNRGLGNTSGTNGLRQLLSHSKTLHEISNNFLVYWGTNTIYKKGLLNRRKAEKQLFDKVVNTKVKSEVEVKSKTTQYRVIASELNIRKSPTMASPVVGLLKRGQTVQVFKISDGWAHIKSTSRTVFVNAKYIKKV